MARPASPADTATGSAEAAPRFVDDYLLALLARASHAVSSEFHSRLRSRGVGVPEWRVLATLSDSEGETVTAIADACLLQQPTATKVLDRMERDGMVRRRSDPRDRRLVRVALTQRGEAVAADLLTLARAHEAEVLARHPEAEAMQLKSLLRSLIARHRGGRR
jgi:DNA-binding MarR family transcriptional regulator